MTTKDDAAAGTPPDPSDLNDILRTIREVNVSLERRYARALGVSMMIWGLAAGSIFLFYQLVAWDPDPYVAVFGRALAWVWIGPIALGYVASSVVGTRLGRMGADAATRSRFRQGLIPGALATILVTTLILTDHSQYINGGVVLIVGAATSYFCYRAPPNAPGRSGLPIGIAMTLIGIALLFAHPAWSSGAAGIVFLAGFLLMGTVIYRGGR